MKFRRVLAIICLVSQAAGEPVDTGFSESVWASGLSEPVGIAWAPDGSGRLFVTERASGVRIVKDGVVQSTPFASFSQVYSYSECGVLSLAFDPNFVTNHYVYVFVTVSSSEQRIVRFTDVDGVGTAPVDIIKGLPTLGQNHDGGALGFGGDGKLYWAVGDLGDKRGVDGNLGSLAGKVGRANPDGSVPLDNPFRDGAGPFNDYIWATGFRNPFSLAVNPRTGRIWLNVAGSTPGGETQPNSGPGYEQVFVPQAGDDGGYDDYEGNQPVGRRYSAPFPRPLAHPVIQYKTDDVGDQNQVRTIAALTAANGIATLTTTARHPYRVGQALVISGAGVLDGYYFVSSVTATKCSLTGATTTGTANTGSVAPLVQGGAITGGEFYESTAFPLAYRGNFFYGDYVLGSIMRAELGADSRPVRVVPFATGIQGVTDIATGPDGALYCTEIGSGNIVRIAASAPTGLIVQPTAIQMREGGKSVFNVRLASAPEGTENVTLHADLDGVVVSPAMLSFSAADFAQPQVVTASFPSTSSNSHSVANVSLTGAASAATVRITVGYGPAADTVLSANTLELTEGTSGSVQVSLSAQPTRSVAVITTRARGGRGSRVLKGSILRFTPANWATPRDITFRAFQDLNRVNDSAVFRVRARGFAEKTIRVSTRDNDPSPPKFTTSPPKTAVVGLPLQYAAAARGLPAPVFSLLSGPTGAAIDPASGTMVWTPAAAGLANFTLQADNGRRPPAFQVFSVMASDNTGPTAQLIAPADGASVSGADAEFFGNGLDDYRCVKAEFRIDGVLAYTDTNYENHFHLGGAHNLWDTTTLSNGPHTLTLTVYDDFGLSGSDSATVTVGNP